MQPMQRARLASRSTRWAARATRTFTPAKERILVKAKVAARRAKMAVKGKIPARARADAPLTAASLRGKHWAFALRRRGTWRTGVPSFDPPQSQTFLH